jgi:hypothetical protein
VTVGADVYIHQPRLLLAYLCVAVLQVAAAFAGRFHFCARKRDAAFMSLEYVEVMVGLSIGRYHFYIRHIKEELSSRTSVSSRSMRKRIYPMVQHGRNADGPMDRLHSLQDLFDNPGNQD